MKRKLILSLVICLALSTAMPIFANDYETHWASKEITRWVEKGVMQGYEDGTFRPDEPITRAEFSKIIVELFGYPNSEMSKAYQDVNIRKWYADYVDRISAAQILYEIDTMNFYPEENITREEALYALANAFQLEANIDLPFYDTDQIAPWAIDAVKAFYGYGYIKGDEDHMIRPKNLLTRAELAMLLDELMAEVIDQTSEIYENDVEGNLLINKNNVVLRDMTVNGNLYLTEGIGVGGKITLENVKVKGRMFVADGVNVGQLNFEEGSYERYFNEPTETIQKAQVKGTIYRQDEVNQTIETYATVIVRDLMTGIAQEPIETYNGEFAVNLVMYQDYEVTAEVTIDGVTYRDSQVLRNLSNSETLNFNLKIPESPSLEEQERYNDRWTF